jgi:hypothetical protein
VNDETNIGASSLRLQGVKKSNNTAGNITGLCHIRIGHIPSLSKERYRWANQLISGYLI